MRMMFTDYSMTFNTVRPTVLISKLKTLDIDTSLSGLLN